MTRYRFATGLTFLVVVSIAGAGCGDSRKIDYSVPTLVKSLKDKDPNMRYWAAKSLGDFGSQAEAAVPNLLETLKDDDKMVRMGAAYALGEIGAREALPALQEASKDLEQEVRKAASFATNRIEAKKKK